MAFLIAALLALGPFLLLCFADTIDDRRRSGRARRAGATAAGEAACAAEGRLAQRLMSGGIDPAGYRRAMTELAIDEARNRPLCVPGDAAG